jgi:D-ribose pyranase
MQVERAEYAAEMLTHSPQLETVLLRRLGDAALHGIAHGALKQRSSMARAIVRTGECSPYANVILYAGVVF